MSGYEAALTAVLGPLLDATVPPDEETAVDSVRANDRLATALFPVDAPAPAEGSLYHHVTVRDGFDAIARRLLGHVLVGRDVTRDRVYREPGLVSARADHRAALYARLTEL